MDDVRTVAVRVDKKVDTELRRLMKVQDRTASYVIRALILEAAARLPKEKRRAR